MEVRQLAAGAQRVASGFLAPVSAAQPSAPSRPARRDSQHGCSRRLLGAPLSCLLVGLCRTSNRAKHTRRRQGQFSKRVALATQQREDVVDVVVIGSGMGGLSAGAILAKQGFQVCVCEAHSIPGGVAHSFERGGSLQTHGFCRQYVAVEENSSTSCPLLLKCAMQGYEFDSGPSLLADLATSCSETSSNPLRHVLNALDEDVEEWVAYSGWRMLTPDGDFDFEVGNESSWLRTLQRFGSDDDILEQWQRLRKALQPLTEAVTAFPSAALRPDVGAAATLGRYFKQFAGVLGVGPRAQAPFQDVLQEAKVTDPFLQRWFDYLCFVLQALPARDHQLAPVAFMMDTLYGPGRYLDYPKGGVGALIAAMVRGVETNGGEVRLKAAVDEILVEDGSAVGVKLRNGSKLLARKAVISNASAWDTAKLLPKEKQLQDQWADGGGNPEAAGSFLHLHIGFSSAGLPKPGEDGALQLHYSVINSWDPIDGPGNVVIISIPSVVDPALAPAGHHCLHAYVAASEPFEPWQNLDRASAEYKQMKEERCEVLWKAVERIIPDIRRRTDLELLGSPLTHARFTRRHRGSYGAYSRASTSLIPSQPALPGPITVLPRLLRCGDSTFPGIGVPSSAASGVAAATSLLSVPEHLALLDRMRIPE